MIKHEDYLTFTSCEIDQDTSYWFAMVIFLVNITNNIVLSLLSTYEYCPNTHEIVLASARGEKYFSSPFWKFMYYLWAAQKGF